MRLFLNQLMTRDRVYHYELSGSRTCVHQNDLENLLKHRFLDPTPGVSDLASLDWGLRFWISHKFLGDADAVDPGNGDGPSLPDSVWPTDIHTKLGFCY